MRSLKQTLADTIHLLAVVAVICMLIALVIARRERVRDGVTVADLTHPSGGATV